MGVTAQNRDELARLLGVEPWTLPTDEEAQAHKRKSEPAHQIHHEDLGDDDFAILSKILPPEPRQRSAIGNRQVLNALLWLQKTRKHQTQLPACYGSADAVRKRSERWAIAGAWDHILAEIDALGFPEQLKSVLKLIAEKEAQRGQRIRDRRRG